MIDIRTGTNIKDYPILEEPKLYIYIMLNNVGKIKIGKTRNIYQRYMSLCGSNGQGNIITKLYCSPSSYLYTLESIMHTKFDKYRIPKTEWFYDDFDPSGENLFNLAVRQLKLLFSSVGYEKCNNLRRKIYEGGDNYDD